MTAAAALLLVGLVLAECVTGPRLCVHLPRAAPLAQSSALLSQVSQKGMIGIS